MSDSTPGPKRLAQLWREFTDEAPTLPKGLANRTARLIRLWNVCAPAYQVLIERVAYELAPDDSPERRLEVPTRHELRATHLVRLWQACTPSRQNLIERLALEFAPDVPRVPVGRV